jgi:xylulokinase
MTPPSLLLGIDLGTSATKAALWRPDGTAVAAAEAEVPILRPEGGAVAQAMEDFWTSAAATARRVMAASGAAPRAVAAIGISGQMAGIGAVDEAFRPAIPYDSWLDMRCGGQVAAIERLAGEAVTRLTGCPPLSAHAAKMLWWRQERPADYARIARFVTPNAWVAGRLAGLGAAEAFIDRTFLHFTGCADTAAGQWSAALCETLGLDPGRLPRILAPSAVIGTTAEGPAREFGLAPGTPVVAGCGDTAASALGAGAVRPGLLLDVAGTAAVLAACTDRFAADVGSRTLLTMPSAVPGLWHPLGFVAGGGANLRWLRDLLAPREGYAALDAEAARVPPGAEGLFFSPHLGGRNCPAAPGMRGAMAGLGWGHGRGHLARAAMEAVAFEYARYLRVLRGLLPGFTPTAGIATGGGAASATWNAIKAAALGVPWARLRRDELATWGAALLAGHGVGLIRDLAAAAEAAARPHGAPLPPDPEAAAAYAALIPRYLAWQSAQETPP